MPEGRPPRARLTGTIVTCIGRRIVQLCARHPVFLFTLEGHTTGYFTTAPRFVFVKAGDIITITMPVTGEGNQDVLDGSIYCRRIKVESIVRGHHDVAKILHEDAMRFAPEQWQRLYPPYEQEVLHEHEEA